VARALSASSAVRDLPRFTGTTAWARSLPTLLRLFLRTETGGAAVLLAHRDATAVDGDDGSIEVARAVGRKEGDRLGDLLGIRGPSERDRRDDGREAVVVSRVEAGRPGVRR